MYEITKKLRNLKPYDPVEGSYKIRLDANESFFNLDGDEKVRVMDCISEISFNRYPDPNATQVCAAFAEFYGVNPKYVVAGNGSDELISIIAGSFLEKGDSILTFTPDFSMYAFYSKLYELNIINMPKNDDMEIDVEAVVKYCNLNNIKAVMFSNPCNPTSVGIKRDDVIQLVKNLDCLVVVDEAYMEFWNQSIIDMVDKFDNLIILKTCSKAFGMAAIRLGFSIACEKITNALKAAKSPYNTDSLSQAIGTVIFNQKEYLRENTVELLKSRDFLYNETLKLAEEFPNIIKKLYKTCTNFVYFKSSRAGEIYKSLLEKSISVRCFDDSMRITCGSKDENEILILAMTEILSKMKDN